MYQMYNKETEEYTYKKYEDISTVVFHLAKENALLHKEEIFKLIRRSYFNFLEENELRNELSIVDEFLHEEPTFWDYSGRRRGWKLYENIYGENYKTLRRDLYNFIHMLEEWINV